MYKAAIFDMDETLVYLPLEAQVYWTKKCYEKITGRVYSDEEIGDYMNLSYPERNKVMLESGFESLDHFMSFWLTDEALKYRRENLVVAQGIDVLLGIKNLGIKLGVVTSAPYILANSQRMRIENDLGVDGLFESFVCIRGNPLKLLKSRRLMH